MKTYNIRKGYDIPIAGEAKQEIADAPAPTSVGIHPIAFRGLKPRLLVKTGDTVKTGTPLFQDKSRPEIQFCSPAAGTVADIVYGARRAIESIQITPAGEEHEQHESFGPGDIASIKRDDLVKLLLKGGMWPYLRQRPFDKIPDADSVPHSIFVNCMDTAPLAGDPEFALAGKGPEFKAGVDALKILAGEGDVHVVADGNARDSEFLKVEGVKKHRFKGAHPAGLVGTHISYLDPLLGGKTVWYLNARDVVLLGSFLLVGRYPTERIVTVAGPGLTEAKYLRTTIGAQVAGLIGDILGEGELRVISGNVLTGRHIILDNYVGFYDDQITVLNEDRERRFIGWMLPGLRRWSYSKAFLSAILPGEKFPMTTNQNGEHRGLVKTGDYEKMVTLDVLPDFMVKAILADDIDMMEQLGILECSPEDFALCSYICPSKTEFTEIIQQGLDMMEKEMAPVEGH